MKQTTLCFPVIGEPITKILLGYKKINFGVGKYTGFGGKIEAGETPVAAAARELWEETGLVVDADALRPAGVLRMVFPERSSWNQTIHLFTADAWAGEPVESNEMRPRWFRTDAI